VLLCAQTFSDHHHPPMKPELFAGNLFSTGMRERDFALSPDGTEIFYTLQSPLAISQTIVYSKKDITGSWSEPQTAPFSGHYSDLEPVFSMDGQKLFFSSNRPLSGNAVKDFDIWIVEKKDGEWKTPYNLGTPVNTTADEYYPAITNNGNLYFTAAYDHGLGKEDIYKATWNGDRYTAVKALDGSINSTGFEFNAYVSPDEQLIIYTAYGRSDDKGRGDLYMSVKDTAGNWKPAKNMKSLNSDRIDYCPFVSFDKKILFFTSERTELLPVRPVRTTYSELSNMFSSPKNGFGDIYWVAFDQLAYWNKANE
jgi:hypothetical protein